ncbi:cell division protein PerM [Actinomyces sp. zg-332]|uniref:cell division protein PerM n=1 Tax=Actinomyces sp. zg-332 TaxID=2708340 RepID=UPI001E322502|nr:DUF6350 family protein [Actinomyces sp. zg-332]
MNKIYKRIFSGNFKKFNTDKTITRVVKQDNTSEILISMPTGWAGTIIVGSFVAIFSWIIPVLFSLLSYFSSTDNPALNDTTWFDAMLLGSQFWALSLGIPIKFSAGYLSLLPLGYTFLIFVILIWFSVRINFNNIKAGLGINLGFVSTVVLFGILLPHGIGIWKLFLASSIFSLLALVIILVKKKIFSFGIARNEGELTFDLFIYQIPIKSDWIEFANYLTKKNILYILLYSLFLFTLSFFYNYSQFNLVISSLHADPIGWVILLLIQIAYIPVIMFWLLAYYSGGYVFLGSSETVINTFEKPHILFPNIPAMTWIDTFSLGWLVFLIVPTISLIVCIRVYKKFSTTDIVSIFKTHLYNFVTIFISIVFFYYLVTGSLAGKNLTLFGPMVFVSALLLTIQVVFTQLIFFIIIYLLNKYEIKKRIFTSKSSKLKVSTFTDLREKNTSVSEDMDKENSQVTDSNTTEEHTRFDVGIDFAEDSCNEMDEDTDEISNKSTQDIARDIVNEVLKENEIDSSDKNFDTNKECNSNSDNDSSQDASDTKFTGDKKPMAELEKTDVENAYIDVESKEYSSEEKLARSRNGVDTEVLSEKSQEESKDG